MRETSKTRFFRNTQPEKDRLRLALASVASPPEEGRKEGKNRRLKQAKEEAQAEIEQYRLQREKEFKAKEEAALGSHGSSTTEVEKETQEKMFVLQSNFQKNREEVLNSLLNLVCDIKPEIHLNYRING
ncbi:V-type proton ATPase subunit G 1 isoform X1 [Anolis carolinensis]|uniref:V-type proton ATPase subunit G 1 isoform X1 n=1 Tax=Anolis carolinensis TaxID=28377 RepID=UPI002F2B4944